MVNHIPDERSINGSSLTKPMRDAMPEPKFLEELRLTSRSPSSSSLPRPVSIAVGNVRGQSGRVAREGCRKSSARNPVSPRCSAELAFHALWGGYRQWSAADSAVTRPPRRRGPAASPIEAFTTSPRHRARLYMKLGRMRKGEMAEKSVRTSESMSSNFRTHAVRSRSPDRMTRHFLNEVMLNRSDIGGCAVCSSPEVKGPRTKELVVQQVFVDLVQKYYAEVDKGEVEEVVALFEFDAEYSRPGYARMSGREAIRSFYLADRIIESGVHKVESIVSDSKTIAVEGSFKGTLRGGRAAEVEFADFFWAGPNGLIKKRRTYFYAPLV